MCTIACVTTFPEQLSRTRRFSVGVPTRFTIGESSVLFLRGDPVPGLWALDLRSGAERRLIADERLHDYATDASGSLAAFSLAGELWVADLGSGARRLPVDGLATDPRPDPAGGQIAYLGHDGLRVVAADGAGDRSISPPSPVPTGAATPLCPRGFWWAPDGTSLLVTRADVASVPIWHLSDPATPWAEPRPVRYSAAGEALPAMTLWIAGLDGSWVEARFDATRFPYLLDAGWDEHGPWAAVQSRDQRTVQFLAVGPGDPVVLSEQRDDCWVQVVPGLPRRTGSGQVVTHADRAGTRHLRVGGVLVTPASLQLRAVLAVTGEEVLFAASEDPVETHLWQHGPGDRLLRLTSEAGVHDGARRGSTLVHVARLPGQVGCRVTVRRPAMPKLAIRSTVESPVLAVRATPLVLGLDRLRARLHLPSWHRPGQGLLPVLLDPYGGASRQRVTAELDWRTLVSQWFAEQGFAVLVIDGHGTPGRGPAWERAVHGDLFDPVLDDQVTGLHEAARRHPELDLSRVGIRGWSFGATLAALAVLRRPDVFHAAVAGAGVTDQLLYHAHVRERFLGDPATHPDRYAAWSLIAEAGALTRPLLLLHGLDDDNVHPLHTIRLSQALLAAGRPHEVLLRPGVGHHAIGAPGQEALLDHQAAFLKRHLAASSS